MFDRELAGVGRTTARHVAIGVARRPESGHGLGSGLLSNVAVRGGEIAAQVAASSRPVRELAVFPA